MTDTLTTYILYRGDTAVGSRAFPADAIQPGLRTAMAALGATRAVPMADISLAPGNVANALEHDYGADGSKVAVGVWRHDTVGGLWHAPYVDYRFNVWVEAEGLVGRWANPVPIGLLESFGLAQRESLADGAAATVFWHEVRDGLRRRSNPVEQFAEGVPA